MHATLGDKAGIADPTRVLVEPVDTSDQEVAIRQGGSPFRLQVLVCCDLWQLPA